MVGSWTISSLKFTPIKAVKKGFPNNHEKKKTKTKCFTLLRLCFSPTCDADPHIFQFFILILASCLSRGAETACSLEKKAVFLDYLRGILRLVPLLSSTKTLLGWLQSLAFGFWLL